MFDTDFSAYAGDGANEDGGAAVPVVALGPGGFDAWRETAAAGEAAWAAATGFNGKPGTVALLPGEDGAIARVLAGIGENAADAMWDWAGVADKLPAGTYRLTDLSGAALDGDEAGRAWLGRLLAAYRFDRYKKDAGGGDDVVRFVPPADEVRHAVERLARGIWTVRDLVNLPAGTLGPTALGEAAAAIAARFGAIIEQTVGDDLLTAGYPAVHAVGRASADAPRLIDIRWGRDGDPKVTLVGKGVCFDTGGLDIKTASGMKLMKKDMGGAAHVLALGAMIMDAGLPVRLRVLVPAVENAIAGNAMRPLDVVETRSGLTIEIGHTDAEGRVILADALTEAVRETPELVIDCATLTGAARIALGTEIPALFCNDDGLAAGLLLASSETGDPLWRMPLWQGYARHVDGKVADVTNSPDSSYGGAITAALFLERFVSESEQSADSKGANGSVAWAHLDMMAWNLSSRPGRPEGGEAMGLRALYAFIEDRFGAE
ncbi:MAG: leucyl aminopeptidase family protein [Rhodospirillales bacterium]